MKIGRSGYQTYRHLQVGDNKTLVLFRSFDALLQSWRSYETYGNSEDFREKNVRKVHQLSQKCEKLTEELNNTNLENQEKLIKIELLKNNISDL